MDVKRGKRKANTLPRYMICYKGQYNGNSRVVVGGFSRVLNDFMKLNRQESFISSTKTPKTKFQIQTTLSNRDRESFPAPKIL